MDNFFNQLSFYLSSTLLLEYLVILVKLLPTILFIILLYRLITRDKRKRKQAEKEFKLREKEELKKIKLQNNHALALKQMEIERIDKQLELIKKQVDIQNKGE